MSYQTRALNRAQNAIRGWLLLGVLAFALLPWYFLADKSVLEALPGVFGGPDAASGVVQWLRHGRRWLAMAPLGLLCAGIGCLLPAGRRQGCWLTFGGALGAIGLLASGFAIAQGQPGIGLGGALVLVALLMLLGAGIARLGGFRGDVFVASSVVFCGALMALFVALPVLKEIGRAHV